MIPRKRGERFLILDFDIENMPLSYKYPEPTAEVTAIAAQFINEPGSMWVWTLTSSKTDAEHEEKMAYGLQAFKALWDRADQVVGHYIEKHDMPILNGAMIDNGLPTLPVKQYQDTMRHLIRFSNIPKTQEFMAQAMEVKARKEHMTQHDWRQANRLTEEGVAAAEKRVTKDVRQNIQLYRRLRREGLLRSPRIWRP